MPFLISDESPVPMLGPTYWVLNDRRTKNKQPKTIYNDLRCLMSLFLWARLRGIDVEARLASGQFFTQTEIVDLANTCGRPLADVLSELFGETRKETRRSKRRNPDDDRPGLGEKRNRLWTIHSYISHVSADHMSRLAGWTSRHRDYKDVREANLDLLKGHIVDPPDRSRDDDEGPGGLDDEVFKRVMEVVDPDSAENPFLPQHRFRNFMIVKMLADLGMRRGELLAAYTDDFSLGTEGTFAIQRRPDDEEDKRLDKPDAKTAARLLDLSPRLAEMVHEWCVYHRPKFGCAAEHPFLIVAIPSGRPLSLNALNKMFIALRRKVPSLPEDIFPHQFRHTWNARFSKMVDESGVDTELEMKWRAKLMGWRSLLTAKHYTKRVTRRKANEFHKKMQEKMDIGGGRK